MIACLTSDDELLSTSFSQKAGMWSVYGRKKMSVIVSQLLLHLDTSSRTRNGHNLLTEDFALAVANVAKNLYLKGIGKAADKILDMGR